MYSLPVRGKTERAPVNRIFLVGRNYHFEMELVLAIGKPGFQVSQTDAASLIYGYACGLDMTRRDLQPIARAKGRPWGLGKDIEQSPARPKAWARSCRFSASTAASKAWARSCCTPALPSELVSEAGQLVPQWTIAPAADCFQLKGLVAGCVAVDLRAERPTQDCPTLQPIFTAVPLTVTIIMPLASPITA